MSPLAAGRVEVVGYSRPRKFEIDRLLSVWLQEIGPVKTTIGEIDVFRGTSRVRMISFYSYVTQLHLPKMP